jgi:hypothetical protein
VKGKGKRGNAIASGDTVRKPTLKEQGISPDESATAQAVEKNRGGGEKGVGRRGNALTQGKSITKSTLKEQGISFKESATAQAVEKNRGGGEKGVGRRGNAIDSINTIRKPTLKEQGITPNESATAQAVAQAAGVPVLFRLNQPFLFQHLQRFGTVAHAPAIQIVPVCVQSPPGFVQRDLTRRNIHKLRKVFAVVEMAGSAHAASKPYQRPPVNRSDGLPALTGCPQAAPGRASHPPWCI